MKKSTKLAALKWNVKHISDAFRQCDESDPALRDEAIAKQIAKETEYRAGWIDRVWEELLAASKPTFDLADEKKSQD